MPLLRRTVSSPLVRASPYPSAVLSASAVAASGGHGANSNVARPRRACSGSEPSRRRVLADIEWWRVLDGQHPEEPELEGNHDPLEPSQLGMDEAGHRQAVPGVLVQQPLRPSTPVAEAFISDADGSLEALSITTPFAALSLSSVVPMTPPRARANRREASDSSDSSVESTPEPSPRADAFSDMLLTEGLGLERLFSDDISVVPPPFLVGSRFSTLSCASMTRSVSFGGFETSRSPVDDRFGDMIFL